MKRTFLRASMLLGALAFAPLAGAGVAVITSPETAVQSLDAQQVSQIYLGRVTALPDGSAVTPVDQAEGSPVREAFLARVLGKTEQQLRSFWSRQIFTGKGQPPRVVGSSADVIRAVSAKPGSIGYVDTKDITPKVKVLLRVD